MKSSDESILNEKECSGLFKNNKNIQIDSNDSVGEKVMSERERDQTILGNNRPLCQPENSVHQNLHLDIYNMTIKDLISHNYNVIVSNMENNENILFNGESRTSVDSVLSFVEKDRINAMDKFQFTAPNQDSVNPLEKEFEKLKAKEIKYIKTIDILKKCIEERDAKLKYQVDELESKKSSFQYLINAKKAEIESLKNSKSTELHHTVTALENSISDLKCQVNEKEIKILDLNERIIDMESKFMQTFQKTNEEYEKEILEMRHQITRVKNHYFFSLAISFKLDSLKNKRIDLNILYEQCKLENVPIENWHSWISQFVNENTREDWEEENVDNF